MYAIDRLLEGLEVSCYGQNIPVERLNLELMVLKIICHRFFAGFGVELFVEGVEVKLLPELNHSLVPSDKLQLEFLP